MSSVIRARAAAAADLVNQPLLIGGETVGHLFGQPLDCAGRKDVRRVPLDELADDAGAEWIAVDVERGRAGAVFERLLVAFEAAARVGAGDAYGDVVEPLAAALEVGARHARVALTATDIGAAAVERVEGRAEQLVAELERLEESLVEVELAVQIGLIGMHGDRRWTFATLPKSVTIAHAEMLAKNTAAVSRRGRSSGTDRMRGRGIHATLSLEAAVGPAHTTLPS